MVRNSADHGGIEDGPDRIAGRKAETGTITLNAYHEGGHIIIEIKDDGKGLDPEKIKAKAIANGLVPELEADGLSEQQLQQFIFRAGFSTAAAVTSVSGRGVGMDVVRTNIEKIGGTIELKSVLSGSSFTIKIPLTLAIVSALIVERLTVSSSPFHSLVLSNWFALRPTASIRSKRGSWHTCPAAEKPSAAARLSAAHIASG